MRRNAIVLLLSMLFAVSAPAADLVITDARIEPATVLPGIPFWVSFTLRNDGKVALKMPMTYVVEVTPETGEPFLLSGILSPVLQLPREYAAVAAIDAGATRTIDFASGAEIGDGLLFDKRLWNAGTYHLRFILSDALRADQLLHTSWTTVRGAMTTSPIALEVVEPKGVDAAAWNELLRANHGLGILMMAPKGGAIARDLLERFPDSSYALYFSVAASSDILRNGGETRFDTVAALQERMLARDSVGILSEDILLGRARRKALQARSASNAQEKDRILHEARADLETLSRSGAHQWTRLKAREAIAHLDR